MIKKYSLALIFGLIVVISSTSAHAIMISLVPSAPEVVLGNQVDVDVNISGLGDMSSPSLGAFDMDITFDSTILSPNTIVFGFGLNQGDPFDSIQGVSVFDPVNIFEVSLLFDLTLQPSSFTLATFTFDTIAVGTSALGATSVVLSDEIGFQLDASVTPGSVRVNPADAPVPEPGTLLLLGIGLVGLAGAEVRRRRKKKAVNNG